MNSFNSPFKESEIRRNLLSSFMMKFASKTFESRKNHVGDEGMVSSSSEQSVINQGKRKGLYTEVKDEFEYQFDADFEIGSPNQIHRKIETQSDKDEEDIQMFPVAYKGIANYVDAELEEAIGLRKPKDEEEIKIV